MKFALLFSVLLAACAPVFAAEAPVNRYAATIAPAEKFASGVLAVERHGSHGRPLILVPGLASGAWAWQGVVRELSRDYTIYVVTLPGFDGRPFGAGDGVEIARAGLRALIASRKLDHPVLIGHSMGATLAFAVAEDVPQAIGGIVAIDGLPVFPGTEQMPPADRAAMAAGMKARMAAADPAAFAKQQQSYMRGAGVLDMAQADQLAQLSGRSDPAAVGTYVSEVLALDLRPQLAAITAPILLLTPYYGQDAMDARWTPDAKAAYYQSLLAGAPRVQVVPVPESRHFIMFDQPQILNKLLRDYLQAL
jgi:pimeloyl-ACP methyl ester carboxylesterase